MKTHRRRCLFAGLFTLGLCLSGRAQAPATLGDLVLAFNSYSGIGDHRDTVHNRWLKPDGSFVDITRRAFRVGMDLGNIPPVSGRYVYQKETATTGRITFSPTTGSQVIYALTFRTPLAGTLSDAVGGFPFGVGAFTLRPSQFGNGPTNLSTRTVLNKNGATIAGFVITGEDRRFVLLRAVGPGLKNFGFTATADKMGLAAYDSSGKVIGAGDWTTTPSAEPMFQNLFTLAGAFPLILGGGDACLLLELAPGAYSAEMKAQVDGDALIEIYFLP